MSQTNNIPSVFDQLTEAKRKIELIRSVTFELNKILPLAHKLHAILKILNEQFSIRYCMILLADNEHERLVVKSSYGYEHENRNSEIAFGEGIAGIAATRKKPINITGIQRKRQYLSAVVQPAPAKEVKAPGLADPQSQIAIPLVAREELVAVLLAESYESSVFNKEDEAFLITLSQSIAVSIQNSVLFDNMEAIIARRTEELQKSNYTKDRLFSIISHDLRGPITSFHNIAKLVNHYNKLGEKEKIERLSLRIDHSVNNLNHLLDNLLHWALSQTKEISCRVEKIDIVRLLQEVIGMYMESILAKELQLTTAFPTYIEVAGDYDTLSTVFRNIVSNAIKYTHRNGSIHIAINQENDQVLIQLSDTGIGVAAEKLSSIFSIDERKSTQGTENEKGTGLGLLVTKEFVQLNKGAIHISSAINKGTEVSIFLPGYSS